MSRRIESQRDQWPMRCGADRNPLLDRLANGVNCPACPAETDEPCKTASGLPHSRRIDRAVRLYQKQKQASWEPNFDEDPRHTDYDHLEQMADVNEGYESGMHDRTPPSHSDLAEEDFERRRRQQYPRGFGPPLHGEDDPHDMDPEGASLDDHDPDRYLPDDLVVGEDEFDHHDDPDHMRDYRHAWRLATEYELDMKAEHPQLAVRNDDVKIMHVPEEDGPGYRAIVRRSPVGNGWDVLHPLKNDSTYLSDETAASGWPKKRAAAPDLGALIEKYRNAPNAAVQAAAEEIAEAATRPGGIDALISKYRGASPIAQAIAGELSGHGP